MIKHVNNKIQNAIQMELFKAKESIKIAVAWFTNELLLQPLILKLQSGVSVELILNDDEINRGGDSSLDFMEFLQAGGILRWNDSKQLLHEKFCIIDNRIVITGSYNWTNKAEYNSEVENIFYDEEETTQFYNELFKKISSRFEQECCETNVKEENPHCAPKNSKTKFGFNEDGFYIDEQGAKYSNDRKVLIKGANVKNFVIDKETLLIGEGAFHNCTNLEYVTMSNKIEHIGRSAFSGCTSLKYIILPTKVRKIEFGTFEGCTHLQNILISNGVEEIEEAAFKNCSSLVSIVIPPSVRQITGRAFEYCRSIKHIHVDIENKTFDSRNQCNAVIHTESNTLVVGCSRTEIPEDVETINERAFYSCPDIIRIPQSVKHCGIWAFAGGEPQKVHIAKESEHLFFDIYPCFVNECTDGPQYIYY